MAAAAAKEPFCEACHNWTETEDLGQVPAANASEIRDAVSRGDLAAALDPEGSSDGDVAARYALGRCGCGAARFLSLEFQWVASDEHGRRERRSCDVLRHAVVRAEQVERLRAALRELDAVPAEA